MNQPRKTWRIELGQSSPKPDARIDFSRPHPNRSFIKELAPLFHEHSEEQFLKLHPHWFLIQESIVTKTDSELFFTAQGTTHSESERVDFLSSPVFFIRKAKKSAFENVVTLGRAENNDITINNARISKFHAYFSSQGPDLFLTDSGSTNGTFLEREQLEASQAYVLKDNASVRFGTHLCFRVIDTKRLLMYIKIAHSLLLRQSQLDGQSPENF